MSKYYFRKYLFLKWLSKMSCFGSTPLHHPLSKYLLADHDQYVNQIYIYYVLMYNVRDWNSGLFFWLFKKKHRGRRRSTPGIFIALFTSPRCFGFLSTTRFSERTRSPTWAFTFTHCPRNRKKLQQGWLNYCHSLLDNAPKGVLSKKECSVHFFEHVNSLWWRS